MMIIVGFVRELGVAERIYCREQTDYGNQILVQVLVTSNMTKISESKARQALIEFYQDYCPVLGYRISPSDDKTTLFYKSKDKQDAEQDLMTSFKYERVIIKLDFQVYDKHYHFSGKINDAVKIGIPEQQKKIAM